MKKNKKIFITALFLLTILILCGCSDGKSKTYAVIDKEAEIISIIHNHLSGSYTLSAEERDEIIALLKQITVLEEYTPDESNPVFGTTIPNFIIIYEDLSTQSITILQNENENIVNLNGKTYITDTENKVLNSINMLHTEISETLYSAQ